MGRLANLRRSLLTWADQHPRLRDAKWVASNRLRGLRTVEIETNARCNRDCSYCPVSTHEERVGEMSEELYRKIVDDLAAMDFRGHMNFHFYNEPLIDKRLEQFVRYASERIPLAELQVFTNGDALTEKRARALLDAGLAHLRVSLHDADIEEKIKKLIATLPRRYASRVHTVRYWDMTTMDNRGGSIDLPESFDRQDRSKGCGSSEILTIDYRGHIALCCNDFEVANGHGDLNTLSVQDAWLQSAELRRRIYRGDYQLPLCRTCAYGEPPPEPVAEPAEQLVPVSALTSRRSAPAAKEGPAG